MKVIRIFIWLSTHCSVREHNLTVTCTNPVTFSYKYDQEMIDMSEDQGSFGKTLVFWHINLCPPSHDPLYEVMHHVHVYQFIIFIKTELWDQIKIFQTFGSTHVYCPPYQKIWSQRPFETFSPSMFNGILGTKSQNVMQLHCAIGLLLYLTKNITKAIPINHHLKCIGSL